MLKQNPTRVSCGFVLRNYNYKSVRVDHDVKRISGSGSQDDGYLKPDSLRFDDMGLGVGFDVGLPDDEK